MEKCFDSFNQLFSGFICDIIKFTQFHSQLFYWYDY